jgi:nucleoside-diphosphate-sugar epimerase
MARLITILGFGYSGVALARQLHESGEAVVATVRDPSKLSPGATGVDIARFDLDRPETWRNLPACDGAVWTLPAAPRERVGAFWPLLTSLARTVVVIGTTSSYLATEEGAETDERAPLDRSQPRVEGEEYLKSEGATILRSAGIYGPGRNPLDWLRRGIVASESKLVNLVHVEDLAVSILSALEGRGRGEDFIVSDGTPRAWGEIARWALEKGYIDTVRWSGAPGPLSRRLSNRKLLGVLSPSLRHTDLYREIELLEAPA